MTRGNTPHHSYRRSYLDLLASALEVRDAIDTHVAHLRAIVGDVEAGKLPRERTCSQLRALAQEQRATAA